MGVYISSVSQDDGTVTVEFDAWLSDPTFDGSTEEMDVTVAILESSISEDPYVNDVRTITVPSDGTSERFESDLPFWDSDATGDERDFLVRVMENSPGFDTSEMDVELVPGSDDSGDGGDDGGDEEQFNEDNVVLEYFGFPSPIENNVQSFEYPVHIANLHDDISVEVEFEILLEDPAGNRYRIDSFTVYSISPGEIWEGEISEAYDFEGFDPGEDYRVCFEWLSVDEV